MAESEVPREVDGGGRFLLERERFQPAYLKAHEQGRVKEKVEEALSHLGPPAWSVPGYVVAWTACPTSSASAG